MAEQAPANLPKAGIPAEVLSRVGEKKDLENVSEDEIKAIAKSSKKVAEEEDRYPIRDEEARSAHRRAQHGGFGHERQIRHTQTEEGPHLGSPGRRIDKKTNNNCHENTTSLEQQQKREEIRKGILKYTNTKCQNSGDHRENKKGKISEILIPRRRLKVNFSKSNSQKANTKP